MSLWRHQCSYTSPISSEYWSLHRRTDSSWRTYWWRLLHWNQRLICLDGCNKCLHYSFYCDTRSPLTVWLPHVFGALCGSSHWATCILSCTWVVSCAIVVLSLFCLFFLFFYSWTPSLTIVSIILDCHANCCGMLMETSTIVLWLFFFFFLLLTTNLDSMYASTWFNIKKNIHSFGTLLQTENFN